MVDKIQSLWIGESLSVMERLSLASFLRYGHEVHLYTYNMDIKGVPEGVILKDAGEIIPPSLLDYHAYSKLAYFADLFRYKLLHDKGGWWVDMDMVCLHSFDFKEDTIIASEDTKQGGIHPTNSLLKAPIGSPLMSWLWNTCLKMNPDLIQWGDTGPRLIKKAVELFHLESSVQPPSAFCSIPWWDTPALINPDKVPAIHAEAYALHLWNEQWSRIECSKTTLNPGSLYAQLIQKYDTQPDLSNVTALIKTFYRDRSLFHCVQTLKSSYPSIHIIVADDGQCSLEKEKQLEARGVEKYIQLSECGLSAGRNRLVEACSTPYLLLCDDDFSFTPECHIERLLKLTNVVDIAGGLVYNLRNWAGCNTGVGWDITGGNFVTKNNKVWVDGTRNPTLKYDEIRYEKADFVLNFFVARTDVIRKVLWDESLKFSTEHIDFCLRAKELGVTSGRCLDSYVLHKEIEDVNKNPHYSRIDQSQYHELFAKKWGFNHPEHLVGTLPTIDEPPPTSPIEGMLLTTPTPIEIHKLSDDWQKDFLDTKVKALFKRFRYAVATIQGSDHYNSLCQIYPHHLEEVVDTPNGKHIIFVVERERK